MKSIATTRTTLLAVLILSALTLYVFSFQSGSSAQSADTTFSGRPAPQIAVDATATQALGKLKAASSSQISTHASAKTGTYDFVRAQGPSAVLVADNVLLSPETRARAFLSQHGGLIGLNATERTLAATASAPSAATAASALRLDRVSTDKIGMTHVRFDQTYRGLDVFGAFVIVHMNKKGVTGVNGNFVPAVKGGRTAKISTTRAAQIAKGPEQKGPNAGLSVVRTDLSIYRTGLLEGYKGQSVLAYAVEVTDGKAIRDQVWIDAAKGTILNRIPLNPHTLDRIIYTPVYGEPFDVRHEGEPLTPGPTPGTTGADPVNNLYVFAGETYNLYRSGFGRDSYDASGHTMHSVLLANNNCPNAYWNGTSTNYCADFDADDVVSHEWGHAYTEYTHGLIYAYQSGALNESYSDIFGETHDLLNGVDAEGGTNNTQPMPAGQRWQMGEDVNVLNDPALGILRDMWNPPNFLDPDKVTSEFYACGSGDGGGVHTNSGVPNHAYAMLVDGKTFNGQTVQAIGFTRALAIYYRAMTEYQGPTTDFPSHAAALRSSCQDLIGQPLNSLSTSSPNNVVSSDVITTTTCEQVDKAILAVEMESPTLCPVVVLLNPDTPDACPGSTDIFFEDWEDGNITNGGWTMTSVGTFPDWEADDTIAPGNDKQRLRNFNPTSTLPPGHTGIAAYAEAPPVGEDGGGDCTPVAGQDYSGQFSIESPVRTIPVGANEVHLSFEHYVATEAGVDGGQLEVSVNSGPFQLVPAGDYIHNGPNTNFNAVPPLGNNTNPNQGEPAWTGTNIPPPSNGPPGSWGTTIVDLSALTNPGDTVRIRFNWSQDGCNGLDGWYVDNIRIYSCSLLEAPVLSIGGDYQNPDPDGSYTFNWTRPAGATGPDVLQETPIACGPLMSDDAEGGTGQWTITQDNVFAANWTTSNTKPGHAPNTAFWASPNEQGFDSATLTFTNPIQIPSTGITTLRFSEFYFNEDDDRGFVEVSTNGGTSWTAIYTNARPMGDIPDTGANAYATEGLAARELDLTVYSGQTIRLRFRYFQGQSDFVFFVQYGWYIDDISIVNDSWTDIASTALQTQLVSGRPSGTRCYRVRTTYTVASQQIPGPFSNEVEAVSSLVQCLINFAHSSYGSVASASSTYTERNYSTAGAINGDRTGAGWEQGAGWNDSTRDVWPDDLDVDFGTSRTINEIRVFTLQNDFHNPVEPTASTPANHYGLIDFDIQTWNGSAWVTVPGGEIRGNDKAMRTVVFSPVTTSKFRIRVLNAREHWSRIVEVEAIGCP